MNRLFRRKLSKGLFCRQSLDSGIGGFINEILPFVCWKRGKYYLKVDKNGTSQECSSCGAFTGKKELGERIHVCQFCSHTESRDTNSAKIIRDRGIAAVGHIVGEKRDNAVFARGNAGVSPAYSTLAAGVSPHSRTSPMSDCRKKACRDDLAGVMQLSLFNLAKRVCEARTPSRATCLSLLVGVSMTFISLKRNYIYTDFDRFLKCFGHLLRN